MKTVHVLGAGAQGNLIAQLLDVEPNVSEIICTDISLEAARKAAAPLKKARALRVDGSKLEEILSASEGVDIVVNALPSAFNLVVMQAALEKKMHYLDMASSPVRGVDYIDCVKHQLALDEQFKKEDLTALINAGSTPGTTNVVAMDIANKLDLCETIVFFFYDNNWANRFTPFWWSHETALGDMVEEPPILVDGELRKVHPFNDPVTLDLKGVGPCRLVDHAHEEPVTFGLCVKGLKECRFKYGGPGVELSESLFKLGLLSRDPLEVKGVRVVPFDVVVELCPPAPTSAEEIEAIAKEGFASTGGAALIRVEGMKGGRHCRYDCYLESPNMDGSSSEAGALPGAFSTPGSAVLFTRLFLQDEIATRGVYPPELLEVAAREFFLKDAAERGLVIDESVESPDE